MPLACSPHSTRQRSRQQIAVTPSLAAEIEEIAGEVRIHLTADEWERAEIDGAGMSVLEAIADVLDSAPPDEAGGDRH